MESTISVETLQHAWLLDLAVAPSLPMNRRLYLLLRQSILIGNIKIGAKLPATRQLAKALGIARNTVIYAFELLQAEGFLNGQTGDGTYVADVSFFTQQLSNQQAAVGHPQFSQRGMQIIGDTQLVPRIQSQTHAFIPGIPSVKDFPLDKWIKTLNQVVRRYEPDWMGYVREGGVAELKMALCQHLRLTRALNCEPEQIIVTAGTQQSLDLLIRALTDHDDLAWIEDPGYNGARSAMRASGVFPCPVPVDEEGLYWEGESSLPVPKLIYITPSHQYPLGSVMSLTRRQALLQYAYQNNCWILEDDYDSEFRYAGPPLTALQGLDQQGRVIYMGTFSKVMFPGLQLGYLVAPKSLVSGLMKVQSRLYREGQYLVQAALAQFIDQGLFAAHIRRMKSIYAERQSLLKETLSKELKQEVRWLGGSAGLHLVIALPNTVDDVALSQDLLRDHIIAPALSTYYTCEVRQKGLMLGYAAVTQEDMPLVVKRLAKHLSNYLDKVCS